MTDFYLIISVFWWKRFKQDIIHCKVILNYNFIIYSLFTLFVFLKMKMNAGPSQESVKMGVALTLLGATGASVMKDFSQVPQALNALVSWYMSVFYLVNKTSVLWCHHRRALHIYPCLLNKSLNLSNPHTSS